MTTVLVMKPSRPDILNITLSGNDCSLVGDTKSTHVRPSVIPFVIFRLIKPSATISFRGFDLMTKRSSTPSKVSVYIEVSHPHSNHFRGLQLTDSSFVVDSLFSMSQSRRQFNRSRKCKPLSYDMSPLLAVTTILSCLF